MKREMYEAIESDGDVCLTKLKRDLERGVKYFWENRDRRMRERKEKAMKNITVITIKNEK